MSAILWIVMFVSAWVAAAIISRGHPHLFAALSITLVGLSCIVYLMAIIPFVPSVVAAR